MKKIATSTKIAILISIAFVAVAADIATSRKYAVEESTYRLESEFDGVTSATTKVAIVPSDYQDLDNPVARTVNPSYSQIEDMVREAIELQGGLDWVIEKDDKVMIKVNLVGKNSPSGQGETTDVRVVKALIKIIHEFTEGDVEITIAEGTARTNDVVTESGSVWDNSGYQALLTDTSLTSINFSLFNLNQPYEDLIEISLGNKATAAPHGGKYHVHKKELEADVYIVVPVLKIHDTGLTNALKNQIGTAPGAYYGYNKMKGSSYYRGLVHDVDHRRWTTEEIVDLCAIADVDFVVVDAIMCLESYKTYNGDNQVRFNTVLAGSDPVSIDHVCAKMLSLNPDDIAHVTLAEKIGLGTNNSDQIEIYGASIDDVKKKVAKNSAPNGVFGQSNRTWLLSESFSSVSISEELIDGEKDMEPIGGEDGWSKSVYFFDDRIDLLSYYGGAENIISYAFTSFTSPKAKNAELWLGTHEDIVVYLNGEQVHSFTGVKVFGDYDLYTDIVPIKIKEGDNSLMIKTLNKYGDYSFTLNICEVESYANGKGNRVDGLKFFTTDSKPDDTNPGDTNSGGADPTVLVDYKRSEANVKIWPNPASEYLSISLSIENNTHSKIFISDITGKKVAYILDENVSAGEHKFNWDLSSIKGGKVKAGVYICTVISEGKRNSKRVLIQ